MLAGGVIIFAALAAYHNSFGIPFLFDDAGSVINNHTIRSLSTALSPPPGGTPASGRPVDNLSFALNYALSGLDVRSYHVVNLAIHILAGLTLYGIVRRLLIARGWRLEGGGGRDVEKTLLALAVASIWTLHPLQTESVDYISQRAESLMGLFYLLTMYCFIRYADETGDGRREVEGGRIQASPPGSSLQPPASRWAWLSVLACFFGMATKEVMVSAPLMVLLYDRTFVAGTFGEAWRLRRKYYLGLACTWLVLIYLVLGAGNRGGTAGFGISVTPWAYALTQFQAIVHYLRLVIWPQPLVFYYGRTLGVAAGNPWVDGAIVVGLVAATIYALVHYPKLGFAGAWFFAILAPSSSVVPVGTEMIAEHRMYLPLAAVIVAVVCGIYFWVRRHAGRRGAMAWLFICMAVAAGMGFMSERRNQAYRSSVALWGDTVGKMPGSPAARNNLGIALADAGRLPEAIAQYEEALRADADHPEILNSLGAALVGVGRIPEAIAAYEQALHLKPDYASAHDNLGVALTEIGRLPEAVEHFKRAVDIYPGDPLVYYNMAIALAGQGRFPEAVAACEHALRLKPNFPEAENDLGDLLRAAGSATEAGAHYENAVRLKPDFPEARNNLGGALLEAGRNAEAIVQYQEALRLKPDYFEAHCNLGNVLAASGRLADARTQFEEALRLRPDDAGVRANLARVQRLQQDP